MEHEKKNQSHIEESAPAAPKSTHQGKTRKGKKRGWLILVVLILILLGYFYFQQILLDIEAEAIVYARMTAEAMQSIEPDNNDESQSKVIEVTATPTILQASDTVSTDYWHTQTVSVQLTAVSEFQETATAD